MIKSAKRRTCCPLRSYTCNNTPLADRNAYSIVVALDMDLMDLGGWKSVAMVRRYRKVIDERLDDVMDAFNENSGEQESEW